MRGNRRNESRNRLKSRSRNCKIHQNKTFHGVSQESKFKKFQNFNFNRSSLP